MEVPSEVLQKLVCERCDGYLSRGPVHLVDRLKYRCGRCEISEEDKEGGIRMDAYEELAKLMIFPCRYREYGCTSKSNVCTATKKIYHSVRVLDDPAKASNFTYTLDMQSKYGKITQYGNVMPRELMVLQVDTSVATGINTLLEIMKDIKDTTFTVTIESSSQVTSSSNTLDHNAPPVKILVTNVWCGQCKTLTEPAYRGEWKCTRHIPGRRPCRYSTEGCTYSDIGEKCGKHEMHYCQYRMQCEICLIIITGTTLDSHRIQAHGDVTHRAGTVCTVSPDNNWKRLIIDCDLGKVVCEYRLGWDSDFSLWVYTPLPTAQFYKYRCTVELSHPDTGHTLICIPTVRYDSIDDWHVNIPRTDYNAYVHDGKINIKINITKIDDPRQFSI